MPIISYRSGSSISDVGIDLSRCVSCRWIMCGWCISIIVLSLFLLASLLRLWQFIVRIVSRYSIQDEMYIKKNTKLNLIFINNFQDYYHYFIFDQIIIYGCPTGQMKKSDSQTCRYDGQIYFHWYKILGLLYKRVLFDLQFVHNLLKKVCNICPFQRFQHFPKA
jgi:hypothetical protein